MKKFNIYASTIQSNWNLESIQGLLFETVDEAILYAKEFAEELYCLNPVRDILEIMEEANVREEVARHIFSNDMKGKTIFRVEELIEVDGKVVQIVNHVGAE